eukprot:TRINITY_DN405_c0_g1_i2.p1 TRINITY_DN405_c0_g1~~TRINITY_DN405_c0_g1_i2.p1  ORF type:complete len:123 (-),score=10.77 TRINITY_DN405_c0_g1_i2:179-547(-)
MSSQRPHVQVHQNTYAFRHNPRSKKTKKILESPNEGLCVRCTEQIEWRKKYRKYKPLTQKKRCTACKEIKIDRAYHVLCAECAKKLQVCAKCREPKKVVNEFGSTVIEKQKIEDMYSDDDSG